MNITKHIVTKSNWDAGRAGHQVTGIVLHTMVGYLQGSEDTFNNPQLEVSVHYGIGMDGSIRQWVEEADTAYQAGNYQVNLATIGIEHEDHNNPNDSKRTPELYESSSSLVADICKCYGFPADANHIFLHKNVIDKTHYPGGTACPDGLDTNRIITMAAQKLQGVPMDQGTVTNLYLSGWQRQPTPEELKTWVGKPMQDFFYTGGKNQYEYLWQQVRTLQQRAGDLQKQVEAQSNPTPLKPGTYKVG